MQTEVSPKAATPHHDILDTLKHRWSPRAFSDRPVEEEKLRSLLEAARWAASSYNEQPWRFVLATKAGPAAYERLLGCLNENNQKWARTAPVLVLSFAKKTFSKGDKVNRPPGTTWGWRWVICSCRRRSSGSTRTRWRASCRTRSARRTTCRTTSSR
ncbi:MAG: nitroreductase family protein [Rhodothermales bacterium]